MFLREENAVTFLKVNGVRKRIIWRGVFGVADNSAGAQEVVFSEALIGLRLQQTSLSLLAFAHEIEY